MRLSKIKHALRAFGLVTALGLGLATPLLVAPSAHSDPTPQPDPVLSIQSIVVSHSPSGQLLLTITVKKDASSLEIDNVQIGVGLVEDSLTWSGDNFGNRQFTCSDTVKVVNGYGKLSSGTDTLTCTYAFPHDDSTCVAGDKAIYIAAKGNLNPGHDNRKISVGPAKYTVPCVQLSLTKTVALESSPASASVSQFELTDSSASIIYYFTTTYSYVTEDTDPLDGIVLSNIDLSKVKLTDTDRSVTLAGCDLPQPQPVGEPGITVVQILCRSNPVSNVLVNLGTWNNNEHLNTASVQYQINDTVTLATDESTAIINIPTPRPILTLEKTVEYLGDKSDNYDSNTIDLNSFDVGVQYHLYVSNGGKAPASNVTINDPMLINDIADCGNGNTGKLQQIQIATLDPGAYFECTVMHWVTTDDPLDEDTCNISNTAVVNYYDNLTPMEPVKDSAYLHVEQQSLDISLIIDGPDTAKTGDELTYQYIIVNNGAALRSISLTNTLTGMILNSELACTTTIDSQEELFRLEQDPIAMDQVVTCTNSYKVATDADNQIMLSSTVSGSAEYTQCLSDSAEPASAIASQPIDITAGDNNPSEPENPVVPPVNPYTPDQTQPSPHHHGAVVGTGHKTPAPTATPTTPACDPTTGTCQAVTGGTVTTNNFAPFLMIILVSMGVGAWILTARRRLTMAA